MSNEINPTLLEDLIKNGYYELISKPKFIPKPGVPVRKSGIYEYYSVLLNEQKEDFKILHLKTIRASKQYTEVSVEEVRNLLAEDHPVLKVVEQLNSFKELKIDLSNENKSNKSLKL